MLIVLVRRAIRLGVVLAGVSLVTFAILHVSGDPVALVMPEAPEADRAALRSPWGSTTPAFPGLAILLTVLAINLVGDRLRDALDPRIA